MIKEFKDFAVKGNVIDMAVGIIIGAAFGTVVKSLVDNVIMPPIGLLLGGVDFSELAIVLKDAVFSETGEEVTAAVTIGYGTFINSVISFLIVAWAVFLLVKSINVAKKKEEAAPAPAPTTKACPECAMDIPVAAKRCGYCGTEQPANAA
jgi:large conductance mechanosensitive channel